MLKMNYKNGLMIGNKNGKNVFVYGMVKDMLTNGLIGMCAAVEHFGIYVYVLIDNKMEQHMFKSNIEVLAYIEENYA